MEIGEKLRNLRIQKKFNARRIRRKERIYPRLYFPIGAGFKLTINGNIFLNFRSTRRDARAVLVSNRLNRKLSTMKKKVPSIMMKNMAMN